MTADLSLDILKELRIMNGLKVMELNYSIASDKLNIGKMGVDEFEDVLDEILNRSGELLKL